MKLLVVLGEAVTDDRVRDEVMKHLDDGEGEIFVLAPAFAQNRLHQFTGDVDEGIDVAKKRLEETLEELRAGGAKVDGVIGDSEPDRAIDDTLARFPADEILIITHPDDDAQALEPEAFERASKYFDQPVTRVVVERDGDAERITDVEEGPAGRQDRPEEEPQPRNLPPLAPRDVLGILIAIVGTLVLWVLAGTCESGDIDESSTGGLRPTEGGEGLNACDARLLIAGAVSLINLAHIAGLMLFESVRYRGFWAKFFSWASLVLTPLAIIVSLIIG